MLNSPRAEMLLSVTIVDNGKPPRLTVQFWFFLNSTATKIDRPLPALTDFGNLSYLPAVRTITPRTRNYDKL